MRAFPDPREPSIVWVGEEALAIVKPAGMHTAPLPGAAIDGTLLEWAFRAEPSLNVGFLGPEGGLVNRLDRATSGLVVFARSQRALDRCRAEQPLRKLYLARCVASSEGLAGSTPELAPVGLSGEPLRRYTVRSRFRPYGPGGARVACVAEDAVDSLQPKRRAALAPGAYRSEVRYLGAALDGTFAFAVEIRRGFRHQIRAHLAWSGFPIAGDETYLRVGGSWPWPRMFLHSYALGIEADGRCEWVGVAR